jgi:hypothetical protein
VIELCPRCVREEVSDDKTGWCLECSSEAVVEQYMARESGAAYERTKKWKARSDAPEATRERQRSHRLRIAVEPQVRPGPYADPWEIAHQGLLHLKRIRTFALRASNGDQHYEAIAECIRQLAVGPEDDSP